MAAFISWKTLLLFVGAFFFLWSNSQIQLMSKPQKTKLPTLKTFTNMLALFKNSFLFFGHIITHDWTSVGNMSAPSHVFQSCRCAPTVTVCLNLQIPAPADTLHMRTQNKACFISKSAPHTWPLLTLTRHIWLLRRHFTAVGVPSSRPALFRSSLAARDYQFLAALTGPAWLHRREHRGDISCVTHQWSLCARRCVWTHVMPGNSQAINNPMSRVCVL